MFRFSPGKKKKFLLHEWFFSLCLYYIKGNNICIKWTQIIALHDIADRNLIHLTNLHQFYYVYIGLYETSLSKSIIKVLYFYFRQPEKTGDIASSLTVSPEITSEKREQKSILMTPHYPNLGSASDWLKQISQAARPIRSIT